MTDAPDDRAESRAADLFPSDEPDARAGDLFRTDAPDAPAASRAAELFPTDAPDARAESRAADLLPEERAVGSADPEAQAEAILKESDEREGDLEAAPDTVLEHRTSAQTITPQKDTR